MPLMIKLNRNIMKVDLCLDNGHFITVILSGISNRKITRNIVILKKKGLLERVGSRKKGYWKVKR